MCGRRLFDNNENVDAIDLLSNGNLLISTAANASIGGRSQTFSDGDLIEIDISGTSPLFVRVFFSSTSLYTTEEALDGFSLGSSNNGFSTTAGAATANSTNFDDGDVVEFNRSSASTTASLYFDDDATLASSSDIDALSVLSVDTMAISTVGTESIDGNSFDRGGVVLLTRSGATWAFSEILFDGSDETLGFGRTVNLNAVHVVPEPSTAPLLLAEMLSLSGRRRRQALRARTRERVDSEDRAGHW
ncbi:MAG: PEP-CTERM sorting domain-containing protein [Deltaproteobacteria bacterium]|nr:PEP-CTERM sorting domain-containing protein [Deltaproteobacteria bacterium]